MSLPETVGVGLGVDGSSGNVASKRRLPRLRVLIPVALVVVLLGAGGVYTAINLPRQCGVFGAARHGLVCEAPLPTGAVYQRDETAFGIHAWEFTITSTSYQRLHDYFTQQLPADGWGCIQDLSDDGTILGTTPVAPTGIIGGVDSTTGLSVTFVYGTLTHGSPVASLESLASMEILYGVSAAPTSAASSCPAGSHQLT